MYFVIFIFVVYANNENIFTTKNFQIYGNVLPVLYNNVLPVLYNNVLPVPYNNVLPVLYNTSSLYCTVLFQHYTMLLALLAEMKTWYKREEHQWGY